MQAPLDQAPLDKCALCIATYNEFGANLVGWGNSDFLFTEALRPTGLSRSFVT